MRAGRYSLWVVAAGYAPTRLEFDLEEGSAPLRLRAELRPAGTLAGHVDLNGLERPEKLTVKAAFEWGSHASLYYELTEDVKTLASAQVAADGSFRFEGLMPGDHMLSIDGDGLFSAPSYSTDS